MKGSSLLKVLKAKPPSIEHKMILKQMNTMMQPMDMDAVID